MGCAQSQNNEDQLNLKKPHIYFVMGGPGSGKGTQCDNLVRDYKFKHLSVGDLLRQQAKKPKPQNEQLLSMLKQGKLVPSSKVVRLLKKSIAKHGNRRYLIDGFPRNQQNYEQFKKIFRQNVVMKKLIFFNCSHETMTKRILQRAKASNRTDDNQQSIKKRLDTYERESMPLVQRFKTLGNCINISAEGDKQKVYEQLKQKLTEQNINPPPPAEVFFVLGGPGSGKGTQCEFLVNQYGFRHLSTGDILREACREDPSVKQQIDACMREGKLVSSQFLVSLIQKKMERYNYSGRYILDGFPRGQDNIKAWQAKMAKVTNLRGILYFTCEEEELVKRLLERGKTSGRVDDNEQTIKKRLGVFNNQTSPVIERYNAQGKVLSINAMQEIMKVSNDVRDQLNILGIKVKIRDPNAPKIVCVLGGPGSGKGTQCNKMKQYFDFKHISTGDLLRQQKKEDGLNAQLIQQYMKDGKLVPSSILIQLVRAALKRGSSDDTFLLDGFPRNQQNINKWKQIIGPEMEFSNVIYFQCSDKVMEQRLMSRGKDSGRVDDNPDTIKKRLKVFQQDTRPVVEKLSKVEGFVISANAQQSPDQVFGELKEKLIKAGYKTV